MGRPNGTAERGAFPELHPVKRFLMILERVLAAGQMEVPTQS